MRTHYALVLAACCSALVSCSGSKHDANEKYVLVASNKALPYWQSAAAGLLRSAKDIGVAAEMSGPDNYDKNAQHQAFQKAISEKVSGILVSASDAELLQPDIDSAMQQGIPVITIDSDVPASKRLLFVGTNNYQAGVMGGKLAAKLTGGKATVVIYTMPNQPNLADRLHGYKDGFPNMNIAKIVDIQGDPRVAFDTTTEILKQGKLKPDAFICLEAIACKEVADVLTREKVTGKTVIAMDTDTSVLNFIKTGTIAATISQKPYTMAYFGTRMLDTLHHDKLFQSGIGTTFSTLPMFVDTGTIMIDKTNVDEFLKAQDTANSGQ
jgi:ribose transport system substrate-binding protein